jgi:hypothetical protein
VSPTEVLFYQEKVLNEESVFFNKAQRVNQDFLNQVEFNLPKIEPEEWDRLVGLYEHFAFSYSNSSVTFRNQGGLEVGTFILFNSAENRVFFVVPEQKVSSTGIRWEAMRTLTAVTLDGKESRKVEEGWFADKDIHFVGYCHSHNTIPLPTPSSIDDATELDFAGIHILLSTFKPTSTKANFETTVTYTVRGKRFYYPEELLPELIPDHKALISPPKQVLELVKVQTYSNKFKNYPSLPSVPNNKTVLYSVPIFPEVEKDTLEKIKKQIEDLAWSLYQKGFSSKDIAQIDVNEVIQEEFDILETAFRGHEMLEYYEESNYGNF